MRPAPSWENFRLFKHYVSVHDEEVFSRESWERGNGTETRRRGKKHGKLDEKGRGREGKVSWWWWARFTPPFAPFSWSSPLWRKLRDAVAIPSSLSLLRGFPRLASLSTPPKHTHQHCTHFDSNTRTPLPKICSEERKKWENNETNVEKMMKRRKQGKKIVYNDMGGRQSADEGLTTGSRQVEMKLRDNKENRGKIKKKRAKTNKIQVI